MSQSVSGKTVISSSASFTIHRCELAGSKELVALKMATTNAPTPYQLFLLKNEYECTKDFDHPFIRQALDLTEVDGRDCLLLEYVPGRSVRERFVKLRQPVVDCVRVGICIAEALTAVHQRQIIHRDINPSNILVPGGEGREGGGTEEPVTIKLIDFGIASRFHQRMEHIGNIAALDGTLAYMAPEQTGRMNRRVDGRSDLYSVGVVLYEILTGQLPFIADTPQAMIHAHLALNPPLAHTVAPEVPEILSEILARLMAKDADDRYQSATGLRSDLDKVLEFLTAGNTTPLRFTLGEDDFATRFQLPQRLYGREREVSRLLGAFERTANGTAQLVLVSGHSGVGKTALVHEVHKPMTQKNGIFTHGKFDQYKKNVPYFAIKQALTGFCDYLLTEPPDTLALWKQRILAAVSSNGQVLIDMVPALQFVIGAQPEIIALGPVEAQNRFDLVVRAFFRQVCAQEHPMVLFIDDLQWADAASFNLLKTLLLDREKHHFLIIGAYRVNEVDAGHPLMNFIGQLQTAGIHHESIELANLAQSDVGRLIADTLAREPGEVGPLTSLVHEKTQGNPFFTNQFLNALHEKSLLNLDGRSHRWSWDLELIAAEEMTANVVDLVAARINDTAGSVQTGLKHASCIGNTFDLGTVAAIIDEPVMDAWRSCVQPAIEKQLLVPLDSKHELLVVAEQPDARFKFAHDRVQQAAYALIPEPERTTMHLTIGLRLLERVAHDDGLFDVHLFDIVNQLNQASELITEKSLKARCVDLNIEAAQRANESNAYAPAYEYLQAAREQLGEGAWTADHGRAVRITTSMCQLSFLMGQFDSMERHIDELLTNSTTILDQLGGHEIRIQHLIAMSKQTEALQLGLQVFERLDGPLATELLPDMNVGAISERPWMSDPKRLVAMRVLNHIITPAWAASPDDFERICITMANMSYLHGNSVYSAVGYAFYGGYLCGQGDIQRGYDFGKLAMDIAALPEAKSLRARVGVLYFATVMHWKESVRATVAPFYEVFPLAIETGDLEFACYAIVEPDIYSFLMSTELPRLREKYQESISTLYKLRQDFHAYYLTPIYQATLNLLGENGDDPLKLSGTVFQSEEVIPALVEDGHFTLCFVAYQAMTLLSFVLCQYDDAYEAACKTEECKRAGAAGGMFFLPVHSFYYSLTLLQRADRATGAERTAYLSAVSENQRELGLWADYAPCNSRHKYDLVMAETARVEGRMWEACQFYERAIGGARDNDYVQELALANELASQCFRTSGMHDAANHYLRAAHDAYRQWGASEKCRRLETEHAWLGRSVRERAAITTTSATTDSRGDVLDLQSILAASQTISREIDLRRLLTTLMEIVIQTAGAERGILLLPQDERWVVQAEARGSYISVLQGSDLSHADLATEVVHYVARLETAVLLDDAMSETRFASADYIADNRVKSLLCMPLLHQGEVHGILYLENNLATGVFTATRIGLIEMLAAQITISLQHALLYESLERRIGQRTRQLAQAKERAEQAQQRAEKANREKSDFLSRMSHELRTPLNGILGYAQILSRDDVSADTLAGGMAVIRQCGEHLLTLINDVLDLAKIEAGKLNLYPKVIELRSFLDGIARVLEVRTARRGIEFRMKIEQLPEAVAVDPKRLRQILFNLLDNAVKFTEQGFVAMRVRQQDCRSVAAGQTGAALLRFEIEDTGVGIEPESQESIFRPFEQAGDIDRQAKGAGLGLAITRRFIEKMDGALHLRSAPGQGSCFWFEVWLPVAELVSESRRPETRTIVGYQGSRREILVADDIEHNRLALANVFAPLGFVVRTARDGREVVDEFHARPPDAIIIDMVMPRMTGDESIRAIRSAADGAEVPVIATSASAFSHDIEAAMSAGASAFIAKPIDIKELMLLLEEHLGITWEYRVSRRHEIVEPDAVRLPPDVVADIRKWLELGDFGSIEHAAKRLEEQYKGTASQLVELARELDSERLRQLLDSAE